MKNCLCLLLSASVAANLSAAVPRVDENTVTIVQAADREVTVTYRLTQAPGIVTVDFQTNCVTDAGEVWASIGTKNFTNVGGAVNRIVTTLDADQKITWRPDLSWAGYKITDGFRAVVKAWALDAPPEYMAIDLAVDGSMFFYADETAVPGGIASDLYKTSRMLMRKIPAANVVWRMGSPVGEAGKSSDDSSNTYETPHLVRLTADYYMCVYETTVCQYQMIKKWDSDPSRKPKCGISWNALRGDGSSGAANDWPSKGHAVSTGSVMGLLRSRWPNQPLFDLPTEAQWEYACRAGCGSGLYNGKELSEEEAAKIARYNKSSAQEVGLLAPNDWMLYDMAGNAGEFCLDTWAKMSALLTGEAGAIYDDPQGKATAGAKSVRGGRYNSQAYQMRSAFRFTWGWGVTETPADVGFRVCCPAAFVIPES